MSDGPPVSDGPAKTDANAYSEGGATAPCAPGIPAVFTYPGGAMAICGGSVLLDQCAAATRCKAAGVHLCTASEYLARGGTLTPLSQQFQAWIAGCVRDKQKPFAPKDGICQSCAIQSASSEPINWRCDKSAVAYSTAGHVGLATRGVCFRVGIDDASTAAFWNTSSAGSSMRYSVCCTP